MTKPDKENFAKEFSEKLIRNTVDTYLKSSDFNGFALNTQGRDPDEKLINLTKMLIEILIKEEILSVEFGDRHPNMFIKALDALSTEEQIEKLDKAKNLNSFCLYPTPKHLEEVIDKSKYTDKPFTLKLALGEPHLKFYSFDLKILKNYLDDPRYSVQNNNDLQGSIAYKENSEFEDREKIIIKTFGYSHDANLKRALCVPLTYLSKLSPEKQKLWEYHLVNGFQPHTEFVMIVYGHGHLLKELSGIEALMTEIKYIQEIVLNCFKENLLKITERPKSLNFMMIPTKKSFYDFLEVLDLVLSDNLDKNFFKGRGLQLERIIDRKGDKTSLSEKKGTISLLKEWLETFPLNDKESQDLKSAIDYIKRIRELRSESSHSDLDNEWDYELMVRQREIIIEAVERMRSIRFLIYKHLDSKLQLKPYDSWVY